MKTVRLDTLVLPDAPICYGILMPGKHLPDGVPVIKVRDYDQHQIEVDGLLRTSKEIEHQYRRSRLHGGDILLSIRGTTGRVGLVPERLEGANITQDSARIRVRPQDRRYVYHMLRSTFVRRQIESYTIGQAVQGINIASVRKLEIPWLSDSQRDHVVRLLDAEDDVIVALLQLAERKRSFKRVLLHELVTGQRRISRFVGNTWATSILGDLFTERNEVGAEAERLLSVTGDRGVIPRDEVERRDTSNADKSKYKRVVPGDIAYNTMRMWQGVSGIVRHAGIVSPAYTVLVARGPLSPEYAKHLFKNARLVHTFWRYSQGLVDDTLSLKYPSFARIRVTYPANLDEQERIACMLDSADREIALLEKLREAHETHKRATVDRILSGDLPHPALTIASALAHV